MKFLLVALSLVAMSSASVVYGPSALPWAASWGASPYAAPYAAPWAAAPWSAAPYAAWAPQAPLVVAAAPAIQPGYVAATRGSLHVAPLPGNTPYASHHLNLAPAPGTV